MRCIACNTLLDDMEASHPCGCCRTCIRESYSTYVHTRDHTYEHQHLTETLNNTDISLDNVEDIL